MSDEDDPEVHADYIARTYPRRRGVDDDGFTVLIAKTAQQSADPVTGEAQCIGTFRIDGALTRCRVRAPVTKLDVYAARKAATLPENAGQRMEPRVRCAACAKRERDERAASLRRWNDGLAAMIREFKALTSPCHESQCKAPHCRWHTLIAAMQAHGHGGPDLEGLVAAVRQRLTEKPTVAKPRRSM